MENNKKKLKEEAKEMLKGAGKTQKKFISEFKEFALRGNVLDLAVGVLIGGAFQNIVTSFTNNIISPILGCFGEVNFSEFVLDVGNLHITYGAFVTDIINFIIMAFVVFLIVKGMNKLATIGAHPEHVEEAPKVKTCPHCYKEIHIDADRCPYCTSVLTKVDDK